MNNQSKLGDTNQDDHQPNKRQKLNVDNAQLIEATKIIDLNDDCLVEIFKRLSLRDLFNVAVSNGLFVEAARTVYRRKFGSKSVNISCVRVNPRRYSETVTHIQHQILIEDLKTSLQFVRCFGPSINEFTIVDKKRTIKWENYVDHYVNKYCANTLVNISYFNKQTFSMENFRNPFIKVESARIERSNLDRSLPSFAEWFPNLRRLELHEIRIDRRFTRASFQHLEHLRIDIDNECNFNFSSENAADLLGLNPQLQSLNLRFRCDEGMTFTRLMNLMKNNQSITKLVLNDYFIHDWFFPSSPHRANATELKQFANEHPALVDLELLPFGISAGDAVALVGQLNWLKIFRFRLENRFYTLNYLMEHLGNEWQASGFFYGELKRKD